uniref:Uncharacterized protein n=1 Tax=Arundo donax TaxID=35708 RepID=A0A0A9GKA5_ARUDO
MKSETWPQKICQKNKTKPVHCK